MRLTCPICGARDLREFTYLGDASLAARPDDTAAAFAHVYLRTNPAGPHRELWHHRAGCAAWLEVTRDTRTHAVHAVRLAGEDGP